MNKRIKKKKAKQRAIESYWKHSVPYAFMQFQEAAKQVGVAFKGMVITLRQFDEVAQKSMEKLRKAVKE